MDSLMSLLPKAREMTPFAVQEPFLKFWMNAGFFFFFWLVFVLFCFLTSRKSFIVHLVLDQDWHF